MVVKLRVIIAVSCRSVLIYFTANRQRDELTNMADSDANGNVNLNDCVVPVIVA